MNFINVVIELKNTFSESFGGCLGADYDAFINYLTKSIYNKMQGHNIRKVYNSNLFGQLTLDLGFEDFNSRNDKIRISAILFYKDNITEDDFNRNYDKDTELHRFLEQEFKEYIKLLNEFCADIYIPTEYCRIESPDRIFIEVDMKSRRIPTFNDAFKPFNIQDSFTIDDIIDGY